MRTQNSRLNPTRLSPLCVIRDIRAALIIVFEAPQTHKIETKTRTQPTTQSTTTTTTTTYERTNTL